MRSITRPLATAASAALLVLALAACGDGGDEKAEDGKTTSDKSEAPSTPVSLCDAIAEIVTVTGSIEGTEPNEEEWGEIQVAYGALADAELPADISAEQKEGLEIASNAITSLSYDEAEKAFGSEDGSSSIPGVSEEENEKAEAFFTWAGTACPDAVGGAPASSATAPPSSATAE